MGGTDDPCLNFDALMHASGEGRDGAAEIVEMLGGADPARTTPVAMGGRGMRHLFVVDSSTGLVCWRYTHTESLSGAKR